MKPTQKDRYAFTIRCEDQTLTVAYRQRELSFLCSNSCPELAGFRRALGLWDNFRVATGMQTEIWTEKPGEPLHDATAALLSRLEREWHLFGKDYSFRCSHDTSRRRGVEGVDLFDGRRGLVLAQRPGELHIEIRSGPATMEIVDLRELQRYEAQSPPLIRIYAKPNDIRWRELLRRVLDFLERTDASAYLIRHHYA